MRVGRCAMSTRAAAPLSPFLAGAGNIFTRDNKATARAADQTIAKLVANQLNYSNVNYSYDGKAAPSFFGYASYGFNGLKPNFASTGGVNDETLFVVPAGQPRVKVTLVNKNLEPESMAGARAKEMQSGYLSVPVPTLSKVPSGNLAGESTDAPCCIWQPSTGEMWDTWRLKFVEGIGWTFQYPGWVAPGSTTGFNGKVSEWNGIYHAGFNGEVFGTRACGLVDIGGMISIQDMVEVLRGGKINHAIAMIIGTTKAVGGLDVHVAPATKHDGGTAANSHPFLPDNINAGVFTYAEKIPNGSYTTGEPKGFIDGVPEGTWVMFPPASKPSDFGITGTLAKAVFEAIRDHGMFINDRTTSGCSFAMESPQSLGSPYCTAKVNPFAGSPLAQYKAANEFCPASWTDSSLAILTEPPSGPGSWVMAQPWKELELLEPFAS